MKRSAIWLVVFVAVCGLARSQAGARKPRRANPAYAPIADDPALPRVLLIGDSISIGYTLPTRAALAGKANVHRPPTNCGPTTRGLQSIDDWLGDSKWDVIHFNWGLHDLKYMDEKGGLADPEKGEQQVPIDQYEKNLDQLVQRMKKTGATLIWCSTTPVPEGSKGRVKGDAAKYNTAAKRVMEKHGVAVDDLYAFALPRLKEIQRPANVHFTPDGSKALAAQVAASILQALAKDRPPAPRTKKG
jgi:acyl-CoA thioesterase-1